MTVEPGALNPLAAYLGGGVCMGLGAIGAALGEGWTAHHAAEAIERQPAAAQTLLRTMLVGQAVAESASVFALVIGLMLVFTPWPAAGPLGATALFSAGLCMGAGALGPGLGAGLVSARACAGIARSPRAANLLTTTMLVGQAVAQTPAIFALMVSFLLLFLDTGSREPSLPTLAALVGAAIASGFSAVGAGVGGGFAAAGACDATARRPEEGGVLLRTMLVGQAVCQSPSIFGLVVALVLIYAT